MASPETNTDVGTVLYHTCSVLSISRLGHRGIGKLVQVKLELTQTLPLKLVF